MPQGYTEGPYFSQILNVDLEDKGVSTLLQYVDNLLSVFFLMKTPQENSSLKEA